METASLRRIRYPRALAAGLIVITMLLGAASAEVQAQPLTRSGTPQATPQASENELKAAFLYNFPSYVDWPDGSLSAPGPTFVYGIVGDDGLAQALELLGQRRGILGWGIEVKRMERQNSLEGVNMLFMGGAVRDSDLSMLDAAVERSILTVTEDESRHPESSLINFEVSEGRVRFDVSLPVAGRAGLTVSSRLLGVARRVIGSAQ